MRIATFPERETPAALRAQALALQAKAWPPPAADDAGASGTVDGDADGDWHDPALEPMAMLLLDDGDTVLASLDVLSKAITHGGRVYRARGLSRVVTDPAYRGRGHGRRLVAHARAEIRSSGADLGLFTCDRDLQGFYERAGWQLVPGAVLVGGTPDDPSPATGSTRSPWRASSSRSPSVMPAPSRVPASRCIRA